MVQRLSIIYNFFRTTKSYMESIHTTINQERNGLVPIMLQN